MLQTEVLRGLCIDPGPLPLSCLMVTMAQPRQNTHQSSRTGSDAKPLSTQKIPSFAPQDNYRIARLPKPSENSAVVTTPRFSSSFFSTSLDGKNKPYYLRSKDPRAGSASPLLLGAKEDLPENDKLAKTQLP
jgi:hypothetical protein